MGRSCPSTWHAAESKTVSDPLLTEKFIRAVPALTIQGWSPVFSRDIISKGLSSPPYFSLSVEAVILRLSPHERAAGPLAPSVAAVSALGLNPENGSVLVGWAAVGCSGVVSWPVSIVNTPKPMAAKVTIMSANAVTRRRRYISGLDFCAGADRGVFRCGAGFFLGGAD